MSTTAPNGLGFEQAKALFLAGLQASRDGDLALAQSHFEASLQLLPGRVSTLVNLAAVCLQRDQPAQALAHLDASLTQEPHAIDALAHRGQALSDLGRHADALRAFEQVLQLQPDHRDAGLGRALQLAMLNEPQRALDQLSPLLKNERTNAELWFHHGNLLRDLKRPAEAVASLQRARTLGADAALCDYLLASLGQGEQGTPKAAPQAYVQGLFDGYADTFDTHLTQVLGYRTPWVLAEQIAQAAPGRRFAAAADLGCGTGLMAPLLQPTCDAIDGVDLSGGMLAKAQATGAYRHLAQADVVDWLNLRPPASYDLIVAADVFVYLGDLAAVFEAVRRALAPDGLFAFSVEQAEPHDPLADMRLGESARYAHSAGYVRALAQRTGLQVHSLHAAPLRSDAQSTVLGWYGVLG
jgi:predicted TPR repeat methyltransferase